MRPAGRISPPNAFSRVALLGDHAPAAKAAGTAAAKKELQASEPPQPDDDWADIPNTSRPAGAGCTSLVRRRGSSVPQDVVPDARAEQARTYMRRARMLISMASLTSVAALAPAVERREAMGIEEEIQS